MNLAPDRLLNMIHRGYKEMSVNEPCYNMKYICRRYEIPIKKFAKTVAGNVAPILKKNRISMKRIFCVIYRILS